MKPKNTDDRVDVLFDGLTPPGPDARLRARVLASARAGTPARPVRDVWTKIWENRWLRVAWATSVIALLVGHGVLLPRQSGSSSTVMAEARADEELAELVRLVRIEIAASPNLGRAGADHRPAAELEDGESEL